MVTWADHTPSLLHLPGPQPSCEACLKGQILQKLLWILPTKKKPLDPLGRNVSHVTHVRVTADPGPFSWSSDVPLLWPQGVEGGTQTGRMHRPSAQEGAGA